LYPIQQYGAQDPDLSISTNPKQEEWEPSWKRANSLAYLFDRQEEIRINAYIFIENIVASSRVFNLRAQSLAALNADLPAIASRV
jgi:hypothetical protein